ncbi:MAG TPA: ferric reductase-like transmembrane domain-containing protein [Streptosporangiaceae bacterium]|nr:ferric reductase-like transmembrane domain-containing protein [Streptosporangiaceae bacterium]
MGPPSVPDKKDYERVSARGVLTVIALGAAAVIALWWYSTPDVSGLGGWATGAGEILGLLAGYGVVVLVALMARLPPLERGIGTDQLARWHAMGGRYIVSLVVAHGLLIVWGYALEAHTTVVSETATLLTQYPDVLMATVAGFLLLGVGIISMRAVRRRVRYETWYYLHLYTYLAIALAFSHQFAVGQSFINNLAARFWWSAMYLTVAVLVLWYRVAVPLRASARHEYKVIGVKSEGPGVISVYIGGKHLDELSAEPGQFFRWRFLTRSLWWSSHPYSLSAAPGTDVLRITAKDIGDHSRALSRLRPGTRVIAEGPYGAFTAGQSGRGVLLLAGGVGITPLRAMFSTLPGPVTLIYRASSEQDIVFREELDAIAAARGATVYYLVGSRAEIGGDPLSPKMLRSLVPGLEQQEAYVCGPPGMISAAVEALRAAGMPRRQIHFESFEF